MTRPTFEYVDRRTPKQRSADSAALLAREPAALRRARSAQRLAYASPAAPPPALSSGMGYGVAGLFFPRSHPEPELARALFDKFATRPEWVACRLTGDEPERRVELRVADCPVTVVALEIS